MRGKQVKVNTVGSQRSTPNLTCKSNFKQNKGKGKGNEEAETKLGGDGTTSTWRRCWALRLPTSVNH